MTYRDPPVRIRSYDVPEGTRSIAVAWERFSTAEDACRRFPNEACVYAFQSKATSLYVGKATGFRRRYSAGAMGALLLNSDIRLFVAPVDASLLAFIEHTIVFWDCPPHNTRLKGTRPWPHIPLVHTFDGVSSWWGCGHAREVGKAYQGPQFCGPGTIREANIGL